MAWYERKEISMAITAIIIAIFIVQYNFDLPMLTPVTNELTSWGVVIAAFAIGIGYINLFRREGKKVINRRAGWPYALWLLIGLTVVSVVGLLQGRQSDLMMFFYNAFVGPMDATFYSIAMFYMAAAAFRGYRFRSIESSILIIVAVITLMMNAPIGAAIWPGFATLGKWLMDYPTMGVNRAITISVCLGSVALALRVLVGKESGFLAGTEEVSESDEST